MSEYRKRLEEAIREIGSLGPRASFVSDVADFIDAEIGYAAVCEALERISKLYRRIKPMCRRKDHKPLRFPLCIDCQFDARMEEASAALDIVRGEKGTR